MLEPDLERMWPLYDLWAAGYLDMSDFSNVTLDQVDLGVRALRAIRAARGDK